MNKNFEHNLEELIASAEASIKQSNALSFAAAGKKNFEEARAAINQAEVMTSILQHLVSASALIPEETSTPVGRQNRCPREKKIEHTPGKFYDQPLINAIRALGGSSTLSQAQAKMHEMIKNSLKPIDEENAAGSNRPRFKALSAARVNMLVKKGLIGKVGDRLELVPPLDKSV